MTIALYVIAISALTVSFFKSREKTLLALKKACLTLDIRFLDLRKKESLLMLS